MAGTLTPELLPGKGAGLKPTESGPWTRSRANFCESNGGLAFSPTDLGCDLNPVLNLERIFTPDLLQPVSGETLARTECPGYWCLKPADLGPPLGNGSGNDFRFRSLQPTTLATLPDRISPIMASGCGRVTFAPDSCSTKSLTFE